MSGVPPIRFITKDSTEPQELIAVLKELRARRDERVAKKLEKNPDYQPTDATVSADILVSTYDKKKKKGNPRDPFRGIVTLPHKFGTEKKIVAVCQTDADVERALEAGAYKAGTPPDMIAECVKGTVAFDLIVATTGVLKQFKQYQRSLGPKTPSIKRGTAGDDIGEVIQQHLAGRPYRMDTHGRVRLGIGRLSMADAELEQNLAAVLKAVDTHRLTPTGRFVLGISLGFSQGRGSFPVVSTL